MRTSEDDASHIRRNGHLARPERRATVDRHAERAPLVGAGGRDARLPRAAPPRRRLRRARCRGRPEVLELVEQARPDLVLLAQLELVPPAPRGRAGPLVGPRRAGDRARARARPTRSTACAPSTAAPTTCSSGRSTTRSCSPGSGRCCGGGGHRTLERVEAGELVVDRRTRRVTVRGELGRRRRPGVRARRAARERPASSVHEGRAAPGRVGLPLARPDAHAGQPRLAAAAQALPRAGRPLRRQRVGGGLPAARLTGDGTLPACSPRSSPCSRS